MFTHILPLIVLKKLFNSKWKTELKAAKRLILTAIILKVTKNKSWVLTKLR